MRAALTALLVCLFSCANGPEADVIEQESDGERECWDDSECVVAREASGCCTSCAGAVPRALTEVSPCIVAEGADVPAACWDVGCDAEPACDPLCLDPTGAACIRGRCVELYDCDADSTLPQGTFCGGEL